MKWQPTPVFLPGKFHGGRSLAGYSPWGFRVGHDWAHTQQCICVCVYIYSLTCNSSTTTFPSDSQIGKSSLSAVNIKSYQSLNWVTTGLTNPIYSPWRPCPRTECLKPQCARESHKDLVKMQILLLQFWGQHPVFLTSSGWGWYCESSDHTRVTRS